MQLAHRGMALLVSHPGAHRFLAVDNRGLEQLEGDLRAWAEGLSPPPAENATPEALLAREERQRMLQDRLRHLASSHPVTRRILDKEYRAEPNDPRLSEEDSIIFAQELEILTAKREWSGQPRRNAAHSASSISVEFFASQGVAIYDELLAAGKHLELGKMRSAAALRGCLCSYLSSVA